MTSISVLFLACTCVQTGVAFLCEKFREIPGEACQNQLGSFASLSPSILKLFEPDVNIS